MKLWAMADLHLSRSTPDKDMAYFGPVWEGYMEKIERQWRSLVSHDDLVLLPGDISWAMRLEEALVDLEWIDALPGKKVMIKGNHDYWWPSKAKLKAALPPSLHALQGDAFLWNGIAIGGARLWDTPEYSFAPYIEFRDNPKGKTTRPDAEEIEALFVKELGRLEQSLQQLDVGATCRIAITHYPPIGADLAPSRASSLLEQYGIETCLFGHLHNVRPGSLPFGSARGVDYRLISADYIDFTPLRIA